MARKKKRAAPDRPLRLTKHVKIGLHQLADFAEAMLSAEQPFDSAARYGIARREANQMRRAADWIRYKFPSHGEG